MKREVCLGLDARLARKADAVARRAGMTLEAFVADAVRLMIGAEAGVKREKRERRETPAGDRVEVPLAQRFVAGSNTRPELGLETVWSGGEGLTGVSSSRSSLGN